MMHFAIKLWKSIGMCDFDFCFDFCLLKLLIVLKTVNFQKNETIYLKRLKQLQVNVNAWRWQNIIQKQLKQFCEAKLQSPNWQYLLIYQ